MIKKQNIIKYLPIVFTSLLFIIVIFEFFYFLKFKPFYYIEEEFQVAFSPQLDLQKKIKAMPLEEKVASLFMIGFNSQQLDEETLSFIREYKFNNFLLKQNNIKDEKQLKELVRSLKDINPSSPLSFKSLIAIDQEGGKVSRIDFLNIDNTSQAEIKSLKQSYEIGRNRGEVLQSLGINLNFSPVLEVVVNRFSFINSQKRAFNGNKEQVYQFGKAMIDGYKETGVLPVAKHYPGGLGRTSQDPHLSLPVVNIARDELDEDIFPYNQLIKTNKLKLIMVTHLKYPLIDNRPASLSNRLISAILRRENGFKGVIYYR